LTAQDVDEPSDSRAEQQALSLLQVHAKLLQPAVEDPYVPPPSPPAPVTAVPRAQPLQSEKPTTANSGGGVRWRIVLCLLLVLLFLICLIVALLSVLGHVRLRCPRIDWNAICCCCLGEGDGVWRDSPGADSDEERPAGGECSGEDIYGFALVSLVREASHISRKEGALAHRVLHIAVAILLLFANIALQAFLLAETWKFLDAKAVVAVRGAYDKYELGMYGGMESNTYLDKHYEHRGRPRFFELANFDMLSKELKDQICGIPFAEPTLYLAVVLLWSLSCTAEIKKAVDLFLALVVYTPTVPTMAQALAKQGADKDGHCMLQGLTTTVKVVITYCILLPRFAISGFLLLFGCRCLAATPACSELVINVVALEFVLHLSRLCYIPIASAQGRADVRDLRLRPAGHETLVEPLLWGLAALAWCIAYTFWLQQVLPDFRWDVHGPCRGYFKATGPYASTSSLFDYGGLLR